MVMSTTLILNQLDPSRTLLIRQQLAADMRRRIRSITGDESANTLQRLLAQYDGYWTKYTEPAYRKGVQRAWSHARKQLPSAQFSIMQRDFVSQLHGTISRESAILSKRIATEMRNVAQDVSTKVERIRDDSRIREMPFTKGQIKDVIRQGLVRVEKIARTEIVRAHSEGQLLAMSRLGITQTRVLVEWKTSGLGYTSKGNPSPCPACAPMAGKIFTLQEAKGLIPRHPNCLCSFLPVIA